MQHQNLQSMEEMFVYNPFPCLINSDLHRAGDSSLMLSNLLMMPILQLSGCLVLLLKHVVHLKSILCEMQIPLAPIQFLCFLFYSAQTLRTDYFLSL